MPTYFTVMLAGHVHKWMGIITGGLDPELRADQNQLSIPVQMIALKSVKEMSSEVARHKQARLTF